jgi:hypothetical protein
MEQEGGKRKVTVKSLKAVLKRAGLKSTGKKATLTRRAKKARLMGGQLTKAVTEVAKVPEKAIGITTTTISDIGKAAEKTTQGVRKAVVGNNGGRRRY